MNISSCHERDVSYFGWEQMKAWVTLHLRSLNFPFAESIKGRYYWKRRNVQHLGLKRQKTGWLQPYRAIPHSCRHSTWVWVSPGASQRRSRRNHPARQSDQSERWRNHSLLSHAHWWNGGAAKPTHTVKYRSPPTQTCVEAPLERRIRRVTSLCRCWLVIDARWPPTESFWQNTYGGIQ